MVSAKRLHFEVVCQDGIEVDRVQANPFGRSLENVLTELAEEIRERFMNDNPYSRELVLLEINQGDGCINHSSIPSALTSVLGHKYPTVAIKDPESKDYLIVKIDENRLQEEGDYVIGEWIVQDTITPA